MLVITGLIEFLLACVLLCCESIYAVIGGIFAVVVAVGIACLAPGNQINWVDGWHLVHAEFGVYLLGGYGLFAVNRRRDRLKERRIGAQNKVRAAEIKDRRITAQNKVDAADRASTEDRARHDEARREAVRRKTPAFKLGAFVKNSGEIQSVMKRQQARSLGALPDNASDFLCADVIWLTRLIVLDRDEIRAEDAEAVKLVAKGSRAQQFGGIPKEGLVKLLASVEGTSLGLLMVLCGAQSGATSLLADKLCLFAQTIGKGDKRQRGLQRALTAIRRQAMGRNFDLDADEESAWEILGVSPGATMEQVKAAYRSKVQQWHPDKIEGMAPELRAYAGEQLAKINAAYGELTKAG